MCSAQNDFDFFEGDRLGKLACESLRVGDCVGERNGGRAVVTCRLEPIGGGEEQWIGGVAPHARERHVGRGAQRDGGRCVIVRSIRGFFVERLCFRGEVPRVRQVTAHEREHVCGVIGLVSAGRRAREGKSQVVLHRVELGFPLNFGTDSTFELLRGRGGPCQMSGPRLVVLVAFREPFEGVRANGLEQTPPIAGGSLQANDETLVDKSTDDVGDNVCSQIVAAGDRHRSREIEPSDERSEPPKQRAFVVVEQVVAPRDHGAQRTMALRTLAATRQELKLIVQPGEQARDPERRTAGRRQLDRERHPIEASAQLRDLGGVESNPASTTRARSMNSATASESDGP